MTEFNSSNCLVCAIRFGFVATFLFAALPPLAEAQVTALGQTGSPVHLTLPAAVDMAIAHNHKLKLAALSIHDSEEQKRIAESHYYPTIQNESKIHHITELEGVVIPAGAFGSGTSAGLIPSGVVRIDQGGSTSYTSGTELDQPLTQMFKIHAGVRAAKADLNAAKINASDAQNNIALQVHQLYYGYLIQEMNRVTADDALKASTYTEEENQKGVRGGRLLQDIELGSRADVLDKQRAVLVARLNLDDLTLQLDDVLGLPIGTKLDLDADTLGEQPVLPVRSEAVAQVLERNPTVLAAQQNVEKARAGLDSARDAYIPNITATTRYSYQSGLPFLVHNFGTFGASFTYDLFDGGAREAGVRDARIKLSMAQTQLIQDQNDVRVQISAAYDKVEQIEELVKVSQLLLQTREESFRILTQRAQVDAELASGVASARATATAARLNVLTARLNLYLAQNDIKRLLGETPR